MEDAAQGRLTHHVRLILDNDEGLYIARRELVRAADGDASDVAEGLKDLYEGICGLTDDYGVAEPSMAAKEILTTALAFVDWLEMAVDYIDEEADDDE